MSEENHGERVRRLQEEIEGLRTQLNKLSEELTAEEDSPGEERPEPEEQPVKIIVGEPTEAPDEEAEKPEEEPVEEPRPRDRWREREHRGRDYRSWDEFGERLGDYITDFVEDVMEGVSSELEQSLFIDPIRGRRHVAQRIRRKPGKRPGPDAKETATVMSALGNEHRLRILEELSMGGLYASDLHELLKEISASTLSSHLDVLEEVGLVIQERRRGRYLITMSGRVAIKMAYQVAKRTKASSNDL